MSTSKMLKLKNFRSSLCRSYHRMSMLFRPIHETSTSTAVISKDESCASHRLFTAHGLIRASPVGFHFLPLALRSLDKICKIVDSVLSEYGCQKIQMSALTAAGLWKKTGRLEAAGEELFKLKDRHEKRFILSPTHEEAVCDLIRNDIWSHKQLPLKLYQITPKFRDERRPRLGLLRAREFIMKDLYTFDVNEKSALDTYHSINEAYVRIFKELGVPITVAKGDPGLMGGNLSHEYHIQAHVGEDTLLICDTCKSVINEGAPASNDVTCPECQSNACRSNTAIEVGHAFLLGTRYTKPLQCKYIAESGAKELMQMGCYGLGISRILAAIVEATHVENKMRWPLSIAPFRMAVILPKKGSKEEPQGTEVFNAILPGLQKTFLDDLVVDDRVEATIGKRLLDLKRLGIPYIIVLGKTLMGENSFLELIDTLRDQVHPIPLTDVNTRLAAISSVL